MLRKSQLLVELAVVRQGMRTSNLPQMRLYRHIAPGCKKDMPAVTEPCPRKPAVMMNEAMTFLVAKRSAGSMS
ncbi:hypothetical protein VTI28DRAFT_8953 [Corynascus sepedonium]